MIVITTIIFFSTFYPLTITINKEANERKGNLEEIIASIKEEGLRVIDRGVISFEEPFTQKAKQKIQKLRESLEDKGGENDAG